MLSKRAGSIKPSATVAMNSKVAELRRAGVDIIALNLGEPDFNTPDYICDAAKAAIDNGMTKYTEVDGILPLREQVAKKLKEQNGVDYSANEICVGVGAKQAIQNALLVLCDEGDEVIIPTPCWVSYQAMVEIAGGKAVLVPTCPGSFALDIDAIAAAITPKTRALILTTPNNPTGAVYTRQMLEAAAKLAIEHDFYIIADEIYEELIYGGREHFSVASISPEVKERTITINGFSKAYSMTGWRVGYLAANKEIVKAAKALQGQMTFCTNSIAQYAALAALQGPRETMDEMRRVFDERRKLLHSCLNSIEGISCAEPEGAFYIMADVSALFGKLKPDGTKIESANDVALYILEEAAVATVPGEAFFAPGYIRLAYSNSAENIALAAERIEAALKKLK